MVLNEKGLRKDNEQRKLTAQRKRKEQIAQDKERARIWAENRRLRRVPLVVAHKVTGLRSGELISDRQGVSNTDPQAVQILLNLECRRRQLLKEADEIQSAIQVIKQTFLNEAVLQEHTRRSTPRS